MFMSIPEQARATWAYNCKFRDKQLLHSSSIPCTTWCGFWTSSVSLMYDSIGTRPKDVISLRNLPADRAKISMPLVMTSSS